MDLPFVSVLFITYKRLDLLKRSLHSFLQNTDYPKLELVVADDGSPGQMQNEIRQLPFARWALSPKTRGLGANANAGLRQCTGKYILQLQDDWECRGPALYLEDAVRLMEEQAEVGLVKFYGALHSKEVSWRISSVGGPDSYLVAAQDWVSRQQVYSDTPHLKRKELVEYIGSYREMCRMEDSELDYARRFAAQSRFRAAFFPCYYNTVFVHNGGDKSFRTGSRLRRLENAFVPVAHKLRKLSPHIYLWLKSLHKWMTVFLYRIRLLRS